jgi:hypothetical protein
LKEHIRNYNIILRALQSSQPKPASEDIDRAIDWIETGKYETQVGDNLYTADSRFHPDTARFRQTILTALRSYTEPPQGDYDDMLAKARIVQDAVFPHHHITLAFCIACIEYCKAAGKDGTK